MHACLAVLRLRVEPPINVLLVLQFPACRWDGRVERLHETRCLRPSKTDTEASSDSREATTQSADPAPTTMKSNSQSIFGFPVREPVFQLRGENAKVRAAGEGRQRGKPESLRSRIARGSRNSKRQSWLRGG
eukprot:738246-Rhodomonas_salina.1